MTQDEIGADERNKAIVQRANLYLNARKELLTSLGALALTLEESNEFIDRLVARGTLDEADVEKLLCKNCGADWPLAKSLISGFNHPVVSEPAPSEMESLSHRISQLAQKINLLAERRERQRSQDV